MSSSVIQIVSHKSQKKRARRTRKDMSDRNHNCKYCAKSYLSNAALYTHVKNKHENQQKGENKNQEQNRVQQNVNQSGNIQQNVQIEARSQESSNKVSGPAIETPLQQLRNLMKKYFPERNKPATVTQIVEDLEEDERKLFEPLLQYWHEETETPTEKNSICINYVLAYFLHLISKKVGINCSQFLVKVFYNFRLGLIKETRKNSISERQNAGCLPNFFNQIIMNGHITQAHNADQLMSNSQLICKILQYFGQWIYNQKFTDYKAVPNF